MARREAPAGTLATAFAPSSDSTRKERDAQISAEEVAAFEQRRAKIAVGQARVAEVDFDEVVPAERRKA